MNNRNVSYDLERQRAKYHIWGIVGILFRSIFAKKGGKMKKRKEYKNIGYLKTAI
jgi:hypothetical protein